MSSNPFACEQRNILSSFFFKAALLDFRYHKKKRKIFLALLKHPLKNPLVRFKTLCFTVQYSFSRTSYDSQWDQLSL